MSACTTRIIQFKETDLERSCSRVSKGNTVRPQLSSKAISSLRVISLEALEWLDFELEVLVPGPSSLHAGGHRSGGQDSGPVSAHDHISGHMICVTPA